MVAFILLDSPKESIMDLEVSSYHFFLLLNVTSLALVIANSRASIIYLFFPTQVVSFEGGRPSMTKYLQSFPFPYYILLKNMEALPRALADLLRQVSSLFA